MFGFLFWLFLSGIVVAGLQDLKRREVDNWLTSFLILSSVSFVVYGGILSKDIGQVFLLAGLFLVMFLVMNLLYYGRVFAGGDAKLLFSMTAFFLGVTFLDSLVNVGIFVFFLMISGSIYGLMYSGFLWSRNKSKVNKEMSRLSHGAVFRVPLLLGIVLMFGGFVNFLFFLVGVLLFIFPLLYVFAKGLENVSMIHEIDGKSLREGDWLAKDVRVNGKVIRANWDGLSLEEIGSLRRRKKVVIKEGIPFVPAFLVAFLGYVFLKGWFVGLLMRLALG